MLVSSSGAGSKLAACGGPGLRGGASTYLVTVRVRVRARARARVRVRVRVRVIPLVGEERDEQRLQVDVVPRVALDEC